MKQLKKEDMTNSSQNSFFWDSNVLDMSKNTDRTAILEYIKINSPISIWDLVKELKINRNALYFILRDFQYAGLIKTKLKTNENNRQVRIIYYNKKQRGVK